MLDVQAALRAAHVPGYRNAFRPSPYCREPPGLYCVYVYVREPIWPSDDKMRSTRVRAFLHLYARNDPTASQAAIRAAMAQEGYTLTRETEGYVDTAQDYEVLSEWEGIES